MISLTNNKNRKKDNKSKCFQTFLDFKGNIVEEVIEVSIALIVFKVFNHKGILSISNSGSNIKDLDKIQLIFIEINYVK